MRTRNRETAVVEQLPAGGSLSCSANALWRKLWSRIRHPSCLTVWPVKLPVGKETLILP